MAALRAKSRPLPASGAARGALRRTAELRDGAPRCVVAIGASAGGFDAIKELLRLMPSPNGLAFIILQHLSPSPRSLSAELYARHTTMRVCVAQNGMPLRPDSVYTTPGDQDIRVVKGRLRLSKPTEASGRRMPVDHLFRSLGQDQRQCAIGIVLSGTGSDGALGMKDIVRNAGIVLVQAPETAQFDGMPRSAIATGLAGQVLPIAKMPRALVAYARHRYVSPGGSRTSHAPEADAVADILTLLKKGSRQTFAGYKRAMIVRRIERRMGLCDIQSMEVYARRLRRDSAELAALRKDLLISVTEFFRDRPAWRALDREVLAPMIAEKKAGDSLRAWVAGAATGEEAYTLAMLILGRVSRSRRRCDVQIFGTDANPEALNYARAGRYPLGIRSQVGEPLLKRFFHRVKEDHHYQINSEVRESVIFGEHDLLADPPFSRLDLILCRNVLIYIEPVMQARILMLCHFALRPGGYLFLGSAETVGIHEKLFKPVDRKWHIYQKMGETPREQIDWPLANPKVSARATAHPPMSEAGRTSFHANLARAALVDRFAPPAVLVNERGRILQTIGSIEAFLAPVGRVSGSVAQRLPPVVRKRFATALKKARLTRRGVLVKRSPRDTAHHPSLEVIPVKRLLGDQSDYCYLIAFHPGAGASRVHPGRLANGRLQSELRSAQVDLQSAVTQLKSSHEDLRASHEETTSVNEELQSMNEELESSKEELQSVNEELNTVNIQLQSKVTELEISNTDLRNLLASNEVPTLCIDRSYRIKWFTPAAHHLFNLLPSDIGRPLTDLSMVNIDSTLIEESLAVLQNQTPRAREISHKGAYLRRIVPYWMDNRQIGGVVITFADITEAKRDSDAQILAKAQANERLEARVRERTEELAHLGRELALAEVRERQSIARDLHDGLGQELNAASIKLDALRNAPHAATWRPALDEVAELLDGVVRQMRSLTAQLHPPVLDQLGFVPALEWLGEEMRKIFHLEVSFEDDENEKPLESVTASVLFRAVRELLINVARHANVGVAFINARRQGDALVVTVEDKGRGFEVIAGTAGLGLASLRERIVHVGGSLEIRSEADRGTTATIRVPTAARP